MATRVNKRGKIRWLARVQKGGKIRQRLFENKTGALAWETEQRNANWAKVDMESFSIGEWAELYLDHATTLAETTFKEKVTCFRDFFAAEDAAGKKLIDPTLPVVALTKHQVLKALTQQFRTRSGNAANKDRKNLVRAWNWGKEYLEMPDVNPCMVKRFSEKRHPRYVPPYDDFRKVMESANGQDTVFLSVAFNLAARPSEIFDLKWTDVDFTHSKIRLWTKKRQGGNLEDDWLPMGEQLRDALRTWKLETQFPSNPSVFVCEGQWEFCREYLGKPYTGRQHLMKRLCERAGVEYFTLYSIRHLRAIMLYRAGYPLSMIQRLLRHKHPSTTEKYIRHHVPEDLKDMMNFVKD